MPEPDVKFYLLNQAETLAKLDTSLSGLTTSEARRRLGYYGKNKLPTGKRAHWLQIFLTQFKSPLVYVLLMAALVSLVLEARVDAVVIFGAVVIQVVVGFIQEYKAQATLVALQKVIALAARVFRENKELMIDAHELVPGDCLLLQAGDKIPADVRLLTATEFEVNEAALTGEAEPVKKQPTAHVKPNAVVAERSNLAFAGTVATKGNACGIVTHTGVHTEVGRIAQLIKETEDEPTPLQKQFTHFAKKVSLIVVGIALVIFLYGYFLGGAIVEVFTVAVAVAVSAIPEGLTIGVTIILAVGMRRILQRRGLVRKLVAAETLGSTNVICTDKTGTLTEGKMQVTDIVTWDNNFALHQQRQHYQKKGIDHVAKELLFALRLGLLCNDAKVNNPDDMIDEWVISGNLTERALLSAATQIGLHYRMENKAAPRIDEISFDSNIKYMASLHREAQGHMVYVKGAPEVVLERCTHVLINDKEVHFDHAKQKQFEHKFLALSKQGLRLIALAYKNVGDKRTLSAAGVNDLVFVGYVGIKDPLRPEAKSTITECRRAGITTVMITGDHKLTAQAVAKELGMADVAPENILEGHELDALSQHELNARVQNITIYARVTPQHKLRIVQAWQSHGKVVAMTGDGINDAPAIKAADIGVALGSGTDVAKETADMVILDDNFGTIVAAVEEGRGIFDNIRKTVLYLLSDSFSEVIIVVGALLVGLPVPLLATQILWVNLINDSFPSLAMTQEPKESANMLEPPRGRQLAIFDKRLQLLVGVVSVLSGVLNLAIYYYFYSTTGDVTLARTVTFFSVGLDSLFLMFSIRSLRRMIYQTNPLSNRWLLLAFVVGGVFMMMSIYWPLLQRYIHTVALGWVEVLVVLVVSGIQLVAVETIKYFFLRQKLPQPNARPIAASLLQ